ncbi:hypothetical protein HRR84_001755 [Exophiala dermatitidis]|nr:hypothetical protein HRR84_001755 [Exophiala dermatitidis]
MGEIHRHKGTAVTVSAPKFVNNQHHDLAVHSMESSLLLVPLLFRLRPGGLWKIFLTGRSATTPELQSLGHIGPILQCPDGDHLAGRSEQPQTDLSTDCASSIYLGYYSSQL